MASAVQNLADDGNKEREAGEAKKNGGRYEETWKKPKRESRKIKQDYKEVVPFFRFAR